MAVRQVENVDVKGCVFYTEYSKVGYGDNAFGFYTPNTLMTSVSVVVYKTLVSR